MIDDVLGILLIEELLYVALGQAVRAVALQGERSGAVLFSGSTAPWPTSRPGS